MATLLYRLGRFSYRRAWPVIGVWLVLFVGVLGGGFALGGQTQESFAIPGTESQDALDRLDAVFPQVAGASAQAILVAPDGSSITDERFAEPIAELVSGIATVDGIDSAIGPFDEYAGVAVTDDEQMARIQVQFEGRSEEVTPAMLDDLTGTAGIGEEAGLRVEYGGQVFQDNTFGITISEVFGVIFAGLVLLITFGSLRAAGMPLLSALIGVGIVIGGITAVSAFATVSSTAPLLALMIGLAVGIDYSLFILSRHRNQLAEGEDPEESAGIAVGTAGSAVVFAGITVIIALLGLLVVGIPFLSVMGIGAAFAVLVAIAVATTLLPAILGLAKGRLAPKPGSRAHLRALAHNDPNAKPAMGLRWVRLVMKAPILATLGVVAILGTLAVPALSLDLNLPDGGSEPAGSTQREAYELVSDGFGPGFNGPLVIAVDITQTTDILEDLDGIGDELRRLDDVANVSQGIPDAGLVTAIIQVTPESAPDAAETKALVQSIRDLAPEIEKEFGTTIAVTGATAVGIDISNRLTNALVPFGLIVVGLSIVLLMMVFRSVLVPIKAALGFLLSVIASFGVVVAIFQWGWLSELIGVENPGPIISFLPILLMAVLFGLAMDYEVFLVSGMREEYVKTGDARFAVARGFGNGARVVTAAALIMFFVFFAFVPEGTGTIQPIALGLAVGIAFDAFLVRMTLVPAVMTLLGRSAWWLPNWLSRTLPNMDIEGESLREHRHAVEWTATQGGAAISTDLLVAGSGNHRVSPLSLSIPAGTLVLASGHPADRRVVAATIAGRVSPVSGRAQVAGLPLPSEMAGVSRIVAIADTGSRTGSTVSYGRLLAERLRLTQPWYRARSIDAQTRRWIDRVNQALAYAGARSGIRIRIGPDSIVDTLPPLERSVAIAAAAIAEGTAVIILDQLEALASDDDARVFLDTVSRLAADTTTIVVGSPVARDLADRHVAHSRPMQHVDLSSPAKPHPHPHPIDIRGGAL
ncbi:RND superfamily putative drug exporter [Marisediminicola sp. UYEF4]|uniref:MMPL family transporter n=1 Tax=Marisediminicola sp. UYEF4 TaxID=1756384 RepID=UPI003395833A